MKIDKIHHRGHLIVAAAALLLAGGCEQGRFSLFGTQGQNQRPIVTVTTTLTGPLSGTLVISFTATNPDELNNPATMTGTLQYSINSGAFQTATRSTLPH